MTMARRVPVAIACLVGLVASLSATQAESQGRFDIQRYNPAVERFTSYFAVPSGRVLPHLDYSLGLMANYADDPLVLYDGSDERVGSPISGQLTLNLMGALGIVDRLQIGLDVPIVVLQTGEAVAGGGAADVSDASFGVGDIRLVPQVMLTGPDDLLHPDGFSLSLLIDTRLPTGNDDDFQGEGFRMEPRVAAEFVTRGGFRVGGVLGYAVRPESTLGNIEMNDNFTWGVALGIELTEGLELVPEATGAIALLADSIDAEELPIEATLGLRYLATDELLIEAGGGAGAMRGVGTPDWRIFLGIAYSPADHFDIPEIVVPEPECPGGPDCPIEDLDNDGIADGDDECPPEPEDMDGWEDEDGCPDPDNDFDSILDIDDQCPNDPEVYNGIRDDDGCPGGEMTITCEAIEIADRVHFETDSDVIQSRSFAMLETVAEVINENPWIIRVSVEGHTDSRATDAYNLDLSSRRAQSVQDYLMNQGVTPDRLDSEGFGESRPIATNETDEGRAQNRRVEFTIIESLDCDQQIPAE